MNENRIKHSSLSINAKTRFINTLSTLNRKKPLKYMPLSLRLEQTQEESEITSQTKSESQNDSKNCKTLKNTNDDESTNYVSSVSPSTTSVNSLTTKASLKLDKFPKILFHQVRHCVFLNNLN